MAGSSLEFHGVEEMKQRLREISDKMRSAAESELSRIAEEIVTQAKELCPRDSGELAESIRVEKSSLQQGRDAGSGKFTSGSDVEIRVSAGGPDIPYAIAVHENPSEHDPPTWKGKRIEFRQGGSKFLERPFRDAVDGLSERVGKKMME